MPSPYLLVKVLDNCLSDSKFLSNIATFFLFLISKLASNCPIEANSFTAICLELLRSVINFTSVGVNSITSIFGSFAFDLSVVFVPASKDTSDKTNLLLHQIYDKSLGDYATLNSGRELFVYVFAVDASYSYFVDENHFTSGIKSTFVKKVLPPFPLFELAVVEQPIPELNRGVAFSINGYDDVDFSSYLMYVCPTKTSFGFGNSGGCTSISSSLLTQKSGNFIFYDITQDTSFLSLYPTYQSLTTGSNLTRGNYFLYMLPQNIGGDFIGTDRKLEYKLVAEGIDGLNFYTFNRYSPGVSSSILRPYFLEFDVS